MGLHDTISVSYPGIPPGDYQTKDLECGLDIYELRSDGTLVSVVQFGAETTREIPFTSTGEVRFCSYRGGKLVEYSAYYVAGRMKALVMIYPEHAVLL